MPRPVNKKVDGYANFGIIEFVGYNSAGKPKLGVLFDSPIGKNGGRIKQDVFFSCEPKHGVVVKPSKVQFADDSDHSDSDSDSVTEPEVKPMSFGVAASVLKAASRFRKALSNVSERKSSGEGRRRSSGGRRRSSASRNESVDAEKGSYVNGKWVRKASFKTSVTSKDGKFGFVVPLRKVERKKFEKARRP